MAEWAAQVWSWLRGSLDDGAFEEWLYASADEAQQSLGLRGWLELTSIDFRDPHAARSAALHVARSLRWACACPLFRDRQCLSIGEHSLPAGIDARFETIWARTPWLTLRRCRACGQHWYVAFDTDEGRWYFERLTDEQAARACGGSWPTTFDHVPVLWPAGSGSPTRSAETYPRDFHGGLAWVLVEEGRWTAP